MDTSKKNQVDERAKPKKVKAAHLGIIPAWKSRNYDDHPQLIIGRKTSYDVPENELGVIHAEVEQVDFSRKGRKKTRPKIIKVDPVMWKRILGALPGQGYSYICTLWIPPETDLEPTLMEPPMELDAEERYF